MFKHVWSLCAKASSCSFLLQDVCSLRLLLYRDPLRRRANPFPWAERKKQAEVPGWVVAQLLLCHPSECAPTDPSFSVLMSFLFSVLCQPSQGSRTKQWRMWHTRSVSNDKSTAQKLTSFARELPKEPGPFSNSIEDFKQIDFLVILLTNIAVQQDFWTKIQIAMTWHISVCVFSFPHKISCMSWLIQHLAQVVH